MTQQTIHWLKHQIPKCNMNVCHTLYGLHPAVNDVTIKEIFFKDTWRRVSSVNNDSINRHSCHGHLSFPHFTKLCRKALYILVYDISSCYIPEKMNISREQKNVCAINWANLSQSACQEEENNPIRHSGAFLYACQRWNVELSTARTNNSRIKYDSSHVNGNPNLAASKIDRIWRCRKKIR